MTELTLTRRQADDEFECVESFEEENAAPVIPKAVEPRQEI